MGSKHDELLRPIDGGPDWWTGLKQFPSKIMDQHFGQELFPEDLKAPFRPGYTLSRSEKYIDNSGYSSVSFESDVFRIKFHSEQFLAEDLEVVFKRDSVCIYGMHELRKEGDGTSYRVLERRYMLPLDFDDYDDSCKADGHLLTIELQKIVQDHLLEANATD